MSELELRIVTHHIGGRNGSTALTLPEAFHEDWVNVLYDADSDCVEQGREKSSAKGAAATLFLSRFIGESGATVDFHIRRDPNTSSAYPVNDRYRDFCMFYYSQDYLVGDSFADVEIRPLVASSLADVVERERLAPPPSLLSLDTEGSEWEILAQSEDMIRRHVVAVVTEVEYQELYAGQKLFPEICQLMQGMGFHFTGLDSMSSMAPRRAPVGARAKGFLMISDAYFLRRIDTVVGSDLTIDEQLVLLYKMAFIGLAQSQIEYAMDCWEAAAKLAPQASAAVVDALRGRAYVRFLDKAAAAVNALPKHFPPIYSERFDEETLRERYLPSSALTEGDGRRARLRRMFGSVPGLLPTIRFVRRNLHAARHMAGRLRGAAITVRPTGFEQLLRAYGFPEVAAEVRKRRRVETAYARAEA